MVGSSRTGFDRLSIAIAQLAQLANSRFGSPKELCILLPTANCAKSCQSFLSSRTPPVTSRVVEWAVRSTSPAATAAAADPDAAAKQRTVTVYACFFPAGDFGVAKQFWQHTGDGISSRTAERCLTLLGEIDGDGNASPSATQQAAEPVVAAAEEGGVSPKIGVSSGRYGSKGRYAVSKPSVTPTSSNGLITSSKLRYSTSKGPSRASNSDDSEPSSLANSIDSLPPKPTTAPVLQDGRLAIDQDEDVLARYVEERYGRNLDLSLAPLAKLAMRRRIAGVLQETPGQSIPVERASKTENEQSTRGVASLTEEDVWLYPGGMSAIFHAHQLAMGARTTMGKEIGKSVCFG